MHVVVCVCVTHIGIQNIIIKGAVKEAVTELVFHIPTEYLEYLLTTDPMKTQFCSVQNGG